MFSNSPHLIKNLSWISFAWYQYPYKLTYLFNYLFIYFHAFLIVLFLIQSLHLCIPFRVIFFMRGQLSPCPTLVSQPHPIPSKTRPWFPLHGICRKFGVLNVVEILETQPSSDEFVNGLIIYLLSYLSIYLLILFIYLFPYKTCSLIKLRFIYISIYLSPGIY